jgi:hypothetical protein
MSMIRILSNYFNLIKNGVSNIIYWSDVIWKDRNWDYFYIYKILSHKLKAQLKHTEFSNFLDPSGRRVQVDKMKLALNLIKLLNEDFYENEYLNYVKKLVYFTPYNTHKQSTKHELYEFNSVILNDNFDEYFMKYKRKYHLIIKDPSRQIFKIDNKDSMESIRSKMAMNIGIYNHKQARRILFSIMENQIERWWF